ncbi:MAG TPA: helix-turn-helix transcriptional regulator [Longimicrobium sp.]|nr:helix-turn-helix transcriptional regulator [Longimicrobium sp.]
MKKTTAAEQDTRIIEGSGNVFADLGRPNAEELLAKARLVSRISRVIQQRGLTQAAAAELLGAQQPVVSDLVRGRLEKFSMERLFAFLNRLGHDVEIAGRPKPRGRARAETVVRHLARVRPVAAPAAARRREQPHSSLVDPPCSSRTRRRRRS